MIDPPNNYSSSVRPSLRAEGIDFTTANIIPNSQFHGSTAAPAKRSESESDKDDKREAVQPAAPMHGHPAPPSSIQAFNVRGSRSLNLLKEAVKNEYRYAMLGLVLGLASIIGGVVLGLHGVAGSTSWTAKFLGLSSQINDATPGVILFVVGLFMIIATKPKVDLKDLKG